MAETIPPRLGLVRYSAGTDSPSRADWETTMGALETSAAMYAQGVRGSRPAPGKAGRLYRSTDDGGLDWDDGSAWQIVIPAQAWIPYTPALTNFTGTIDFAHYRQTGKTVNTAVHITVTGAPTGQLLVAAPVNILAAVVTQAYQMPLGPAVALDASAPLVTLGDVWAATSTQFGFGTSSWTTAVPHTWASPDTVGFTATYEAA